MTVGEFIKKAQVNWGTFEGDPDEVFGIWRGALADVKPNQLQAALDWLIKNSRYKPKPADVFMALEKIGVSTEKPKAQSELKSGLMVDYAMKRRQEMMDDWRRRHADLWREAERDRWDGPWLTVARKRAFELAQLEYIAQNHAWPKKSAELFELRPEEVSGKEFFLHFTDAQLDMMRREGASIRSKPQRAYSWMKGAA